MIPLIITQLVNRIIRIFESIHIDIFQGLQNWQHHYSGSNVQRQDRIFFGVPPLQAAGLLLAVAAFGGLGAQLGVGDIISDIIGKKN